MMKGKRETIDVNLFIREIKKRPALYDENDVDYKDFQTKLILWSEIAEIVCKNNDTKTVAKLKSKWKNLRDSYMKAYRIYNKDISKGIPAKRPTYPILEFILPHAKARRTKYDSDSDVSSKIENSVDHEMETVDSTNGVYVSEIDIDDLPVMKLEGEKLIDTCDDDDETETFFRSISKTVKRLTPINRALVKKVIANIVLDVEVREARGLRNDQK